MQTIKTWVEVPNNSDFTIYNLPFGIFSAGRKKTRLGIAIGEEIVDLFALAELGFFDNLSIPRKVFDSDYLNDFIAQGKTITNAVRLKVQELLTEENKELQNTPAVFVKQKNATLHLPVKVGDYTDFYSSIEHATNLGKMFRDPNNALLPNWRHIPVGYHGRASSIVVSNTPIHRPQGQVLPKDSKQPIFKPTARLDFELETGFIIGKSSSLGNPISTAEAEEYIFGKVLFNDWSARDIQKWEYVPLGPFLGKSFGSSISPWVVTMEALVPFRVAGPVQEPKVLPYLQYDGIRNYDINLEVGITPKGSEETIVSRSNFKYMYWNMAQQLTHHTINGCNLNIGDLMGSGTISGKTETSYGSMLEISKGGTKPMKMKDGTDRFFIEDHDVVTMRGHAEKNGIRVGFGTVKAEILPAKQ